MRYCSSYMKFTSGSASSTPGSILEFDYLTELKVKTAWRTLTDTAALVMPRQVLYRYNLQHKRYEDIISRGDQVSLQWGYNGNLLNKFTGYCTSNKPGMPMTIEMEDDMFAFKQQSVAPKRFDNPQVSDILKYLGITNYNLIGEIGVIGEFQITLNESTVSKALLKLKEAITFPIFFRNGVLQIGDPYQFQNPNIINLQIGYNVINWKLEFKNAKDVPLKVIAISNMNNGKKLKVTMGDPNGEVHTLNFPQLDKDTMILRAKARFSQLKYSGFRGSVTCFGEPYIQPGDIVNFWDDENEITGQYWVDAVEYSTGMGGIRQEVTIGVTADGQQKTMVDNYLNDIQILGVSTVNAPKNVISVPTPDDSDF